MEQIVITNLELPNPGKIVKPIIGQWVAHVSPDLVKPNKDGLIEIKLYGNVHNHNYNWIGGERTIEPIVDLTDELYTITQEHYNLWELSEHNSIVLLILLLTEGKNNYDFESFCHSIEHADWFLLSVIIPNVCGCGDNEDALKAYAEILSAFTRNPVNPSSDYDIYADGFRLAMAYQIDAVGGIIEHGGSIGGSYLTAKGKILVLAINSYLERDEDA